MRSLEMQDLPIEGFSNIQQCKYGETPLQNYLCYNYNYTRCLNTL